MSKQRVFEIGKNLGNVLSYAALIIASYCVLVGQ